MILVLACSAGSLSAQSYNIESHVFAGGGGTSTSGVYAVSGTIGQPTAGSSSGGLYSVTGGFWSIIAVVPNDGAPGLRITLSGVQLLLSWPTNSVGFQLQQTPGLSHPAW